MSAIWCNYFVSWLPQRITTAHLFFKSSDRIEGYFDRVHEGWQGHPVDALGGGADACAGDDDHLKHLTVERRSFQVRFPTG